MAALERKMILQTGRLGSDPRHVRAGFTLIELIVVMAMLLIVVGVSFPSLKGFFRGRTLDSEARRFLSLTRYAQSRAVSEGIPMVLWVDLQQRTYGLQAQTGYLNDDRKAIEYDLDEDLEVELSAPAASTLSNGQRQVPALQVNAGGLPAIRFSPDGFIEVTSPETIEFRQGEDYALWITQTPNRLHYEVTDAPPLSSHR
jgi:type II secretion system protein H